MKSSNYARGASFERTFLMELRSGERHLYAVRSAGSHGALDLVEIRRGIDGLEVWGYQLKCGKNKPRFTAAELDYLLFLEQSGMRIRIVWKQPWKARAIYTVDEAATTFAPSITASSGG